MFNVEWTHTPSELTEEQHKILEQEIENISEELEQASDLIFHTVKLTSDWNGPIIMIDGKEGDNDTLYLTYYETPQWTTLNATDSDQV